MDAITRAIRREETTVTTQEYIEKLKMMREEIDAVMSVLMDVAGEADMIQAELMEVHDDSSK